MRHVLHKKLAQVRRKSKGVCAGSTAALSAMALVLALGCAMYADFKLDFPAWFRGLLLLMDVLLLTAIVIKRFVLPVIFGPDDDAIALLIEDYEPRFNHRLIASIQFLRLKSAHPGTSVGMMRETIAQAEAIAADVDFSRVIRLQKFIRLAIVSSLIVLLGLGAMIYAQRDNVSTDLLKRALLFDVPVPRKTRIDVLSGDMKVPRGEDREIRARARGVVPQTGAVYIRYTKSGNREQFPLTRSPDDPGVFSCKLEHLQESFTYRVELNDATSERHECLVLNRPTVVDLQVDAVYPAYTALGTIHCKPGDITALNGSRLIIRAKASHNLRFGSFPDGLKNTIRVYGTEPPKPDAKPDNKPAPADQTPPPAVVLLKEVPASLVDDRSHPDDKSQLTADVPLPPRATGFSIHLVDDQDLETRDAAVYPIDLLTDNPPSVKITLPTRKEQLVTRQAKIEIGFDAADDYGLARLFLKYKIDEGPERSIELEMPAGVKSYRHRYLWDLSKISITGATTRPTLEGCALEYWIEAQDNNNVTGPGKSASEHFAAKVVTEAEKNAEMATRMAGLLDELKGRVEDQEKIHAELGTIIQEKPQTP